MAKQTKATAKKPGKNVPAKKKEVLNLAELDVKKLPEFQGFKTKLQKLKKDNPVMEVDSKETYEEAKKRRLAVREGRYEVQNQNKDVNKLLKSVKDQVSDLSAELIQIVRPTEDAQDEKIKAWEQKEKERLEAKRKAEEERKQKIKDRISEIYTGYQKQLKDATFEGISDLEAAFEKLEEMDRQDFEEFEADFLEKLDDLQFQKDERIEDLKQREKERKEAEKARLEAEKARKAKEKAERTNKRIQELAPVFSFGPAVDMAKVPEMTAAQFEELLKAKRDSKAQADAQAKADREELEKLKQKQLKPKPEEKPVEVEEPEEVDFEDEEDQPYSLEPEEVVEPGTVPVAPKNITQDQIKLVAYIKSISPNSPYTVAGLKSDEAKAYQEEIIKDLEVFKDNLIHRLKNL